MTSESYRKKHWIRTGHWWVLAVPSLAVVSLLFVLWYIHKPSDLLLNLATEATGIALTLIVVDQLLRYLSSRWYAPVKDVAISQVCKIMTRHVEFLAGMYKAAMEPEAAESLEGSTDLHRVFDERFLDAMVYFDALAYGVVPSLGPFPLSWRRAMAQHASEVGLELRQTIGTYLEFLSPELIKQLEDFRMSDSLQNFLVEFGQLEPCEKQWSQLRPFATGGREQLERHVELILGIAGRVYRESGEEKCVELKNEVWSPDSAPKFGCARNLVPPPRGEEVRWREDPPHPAPPRAEDDG